MSGPLSETTPYKVLYRLKTRLARCVSRRSAPRLALRAENPYATHLPILVGIGGLFLVRRVLELGCGEHSTLAFLDRSIFPHLTALHSWENNMEWLKRVERLAGGDPRLRLTYVDSQMSAACTGIDLTDYDLIFIDDSVRAVDRAATIREVACRSGPFSLVIIHDYENPVYNAAAEPFPAQYSFTAFNPQTGVLWRRAPIHRRSLRALDRLIRQYARQIKPEDVAAWTQILGHRQ